MKHVVLYAREGCCLCDDAREMLERIRARHPDALAVTERDIESDEALLRRYLERIPVIAIDGVEALELQIDETELELRLGIVRAG
ncbi:MAG TPA: glutaredoxin family protein [Solirubrobacteraceae bacterium]|jgi:glutaredoxin